MICAETLDDSETIPKKPMKMNNKKKENDSEIEQKKDLEMNNKKKENDSETEQKKELKVNNKKKEKISKSYKEEVRVKKEKKKINELKESYKSREDKDECISHLYNFYDDLKYMDLNNLINKDNVKYFQKLNQENNIQIFLLLSKIYNRIFISEDFYKKFFSEEQDENKEKIPLVINLIEESIKIIDIFKDNVLSLEFFQLKENLLKLIKFMHINLKESLVDKEKEQLNKFINEIPNKFFSNNYLEIIKYKNTIYKNNNELLNNIENIDKLFFELESYYEQLSCLELLFNNIETKGNKNKFNNYSSISNDDIKNEKEKEEIINEKNENIKMGNEKREYSDNEIILYGKFIRKICIYKNFLLKKLIDINSNEEKKKNEIKEIDEKNKEIKEFDEDIENENEDIESKEKKDTRKTLSLFIIDVIKNVNGKIQSQSNENIELEDLLNNRICISLKEQKNIYDIIKENIDNFNQLLIGSDNLEIKSLKKKLDHYLSSINNDKFIPINIEKIDNIKHYSNFSRNKIIVPYGDSRIFYIENNEDKKGLLLVEFYVTDENKDIVFKINKYEPSSNDFKNVYNTGKLNKKCNLCVYFEEQSLYQIEFDNKYSWMNSKEVNFTISLFRIIDKDKNETNNENNINNINNIDNDNSDIINSENNQKINTNEFKISNAVLNNEKIIKFFCHNIDTNYTFNCNKIYEKIKEKQMSESNDLFKNKEFNLSILIYLNKIRIVTFDNNDKIIYTEIIEENEKLISKTFFNKTICKYLNENCKVEENNKDKSISINLFCLNRNLSFVSNKVKELIDALNSNSINNIVKNKNKNKIYEQFLQKLGFYPDENLDRYKIIYNLYDFSDQCLIYHLFLNHIQEKYVESSTLILLFDKYTVSASSLNEGAIYNKFKSLEKGWRQKYYSNLKMNDFKSIVYFIKAVSDSFDGLDLVLCYMDNDDKKDELLNLFQQIKEFVQKNICESINVYIYHEDNFIRKIFKYIGLFINE